MAKRTDVAQVEVPRAVRDQLNEYRAELYRLVNRRATQGEIISALLSGVPIWQIAAMLDAYRPMDDPGSTPD